MEDRGGLDSAAASRLASSFASRGAKGLVSPRRAVIVAEYKPLLEISWNAYDFASERAFNVRLTWRGRAQSSVSRRIAIERACPLAPLQTSRLGLNFDSQLRE